MPNLIWVFWAYILMNHEQTLVKEKTKFTFFLNGKFNSTNYIHLSLFTYCLKYPYMC